VGLGVLVLLAVAGPAIPLMAKQFDDHQLVMLGEYHRYAQLHAFLEQLVRDPRFICRADDVVIEFGNSRMQPIADRWASGAPVSEAELESMYRETIVPLTWNSPVYRQFYEAIREINQEHLCPKPLRLVLADAPIDWSKIHSGKELIPYGERDLNYFNSVEREVISRHRKAFMLSGLAHAVKAGEDEPTTAGMIEKKYPGILFTIAPMASDELPPPSLEVVRGSHLENSTFNWYWESQPERKWPPMAQVVDAVLYLGKERTFTYPSPKIYLEPAYLAELRRRAALIKEYSGQDFITAIDALVKEARAMK